MANPVWPSTLQMTPLFGTWNEAPARNIAEFVPDVGPSMFRRRSTVAHDNISCAIKANKAQKVILDTFYKSTCAAGAIKFDWVDPTIELLNAGSFVINRSHYIHEVGTTDFTLIGAASNTVGVVFTATGAGAGTGRAFLMKTFRFMEAPRYTWDMGNNLFRVDLALRREV